MGAIFGALGSVITFYFRNKEHELKTHKLNDKGFDEMKVIKENYDREMRPYYEVTQSKFNKLCKQGKITSDELYLLRLLIEECMGSYAEQYKRMHFKNGFHRIYTYLKCWYLDKGDFVEIQRYLDEIDQREEDLD
jgi:hypothetical protein